MADFETIPQASIDRLYADPAMAPQFDTVYGAGRAAELIEANAGLPEPKAEEEDWTVVGEAYRVIAGGVRDAANETANFAQFVDTEINDAVFGEGKVLTFNGVIDRTDSQFMFGDGGRVETPDVAPNQTFVGSLGRSAVQFTAGYATLSKITGLKGIKGAFLNGALADAIVFNPDDPNVTGALEQFGVDMGTFGDLLATNPDDEEYINRLRNAAEGVLMGAIVEGLGWGIRSARALKNGDAAGAAHAAEMQAKALGPVDEALADAAATVRADVEATLDMSKTLFKPELDGPWSPGAAVRAADEAPIDGPRIVDADGQARLDLGDTPSAPRAPEGTVAPNRMYLTPEKIENIRLQARLAAGVPTVKKQGMFSYKSLTTVTDMKDVLDEIAGVKAVMADEFATIKGGDVQRWDTVKGQATAKLRQMAAMTGENPEALIKRFQEANLGDMTQMAAEIHARSRYVVSIENELKSMAHMIASESFDPKKFPGIKDMDHLRLAFSQRREVAANLLAGQDALRSNVARSMNAMKMAVKGDAGLQKMLRDPALFRDIDAAAKAVADPKNKDASAIRTIDDTLNALHGFADKVNSFRINALLSGPGTQEVNFISNIVNSFVIPLEQAMGGVARGDRKMVLHAVRQLQGSVAGSVDFIRSAMKAGWYDEAILDPFNGKIEDDALRNTITGNKATDTVISLPSRLLMTMDEIFKQSSYRGRIFADASMEAAEKGLKGDEAQDFIAKALKDAYSDTGQALNSEALLQARRTTFTEPLEPGTMGAAIQTLAVKHPAFRFVVPFVRTPINILSQTYQHFPGLGMTSKRYRADKAAGGVRAAQARGRQMMGMALVTSAGYMAANGNITGSGPSDPRVRSVWLKNNQPYSFKFELEDGTTEWISYARLEPLSNVFSIAADAVEIMGDEYNEANKTTMIEALQMAVMENTVNKTFTQGIYDAMSMFVGRPHEREAAKRNFVGSFVPNFLNQTNGDNTLREARTITDSIMSRTWLYNQVDPKRNALGEPIVRTLPKYDPLGLTNKDIRETDTVLAEITRVAILNQTVAGNPSRTIPGPNKIDLTTVPYTEGQSLYDKWVELTGEVTIGGRTLREEMARTMASNSYQRAPDGFIGASGNTKSAVITRIISAYREAAKGDLPELREIIRDERRGGANMLRGQASAQRQLFPTQRNPLSRPPRTFEDLLGQ